MNLSFTLNIPKNVSWREYLYETFGQIYNLFEKNVKSVEVNDTNFNDFYKEKPEINPSAIEY